MERALYDNVVLCRMPGLHRKLSESWDGPWVVVNNW